MFSGLPAQRQRTTLAELGSIMSSFPRPDKKLGVPRICDTPSGITLYASVSRFRARSSLRNVALEGLGNLLFRHRADDLLDDLAILENQERWNPANVVAACGIHGLINVELGHFQLSRVIVGNLRHRGREHVTRAAPLRPKIDHDRLSVARRQNLRFKISVVYRLNAIVSHVLYPQRLTEASPSLSSTSSIRCCNGLLVSRRRGRFDYRRQASCCPRCRVHLDIFQSRGLPRKILGHTV